MRLMRHPRTAVIALLVSLTLIGCAPSGIKRSEADIAAEKNAAAMASQGQFDAAAQAYLALADQSSGNADHYRLLAAEAWRQEGQIQRAAPTLALIKRDRLTGNEPLQFDLLRAELALNQHDPATALQLTAQVNTTVPPEFQLRLLELRARALTDSGDYWGAARTRVQMDDQLNGIDHTQNRKQILDLLSKVGAELLKQRAAAMKPSDRMLNWVNEALAQMGVAVARPQPSLDQPVGTLLPGAGANVREGYKVPRQIALLLPADGNFAAAGQSVREGFFAAYINAGDNHAPRPSVRVYNSHGTPDGAVKGYQEAVSDGAQLVVGPLTRADVAAVFSLKSLPVPLLALNHPDDKQLPGNNTSEFGLLPETEGAQAADHIVDAGLKHAYVLVSGDDFAQRAATAFKAEFAALGGQLVNMTTLTNFTSALAGMSFDNPPSDAAIFISMRPNQARLLIPQLAVANVHLPVFATSHIYDGSDNAAANSDLNGVEFSDAPWLFNAQPGLPNHDDIATLLPAAQGSAGRLFAFGMDAWNLVPYLDWLRAHVGSYLPGASGQLTADSFGRIRRVLIWAKFEDGLARPVGGTLQMDDVPASTPPATDSAAPPTDNAKPAGASSAASPTPVSQPASG